MPKKKGSRVTIEVLMEGPAGNLLFQPVSATKRDFKELLEKTKNPVIKVNLLKGLERKKVKI